MRIISSSILLPHRSDPNSVVNIVYDLSCPRRSFVYDPKAEAIKEAEAFGADIREEVKALAIIKQKMDLVSSAGS